MTIWQNGLWLLCFLVAIALAPTITHYFDLHQRFFNSIALNSVAFLVYSLIILVLFLPVRVGTISLLIISNLIFDGWLIYRHNCRK
ncbi:hypothetical protein [Levilactobacillus enshiensis]|uniref:hypothetical protein n=1 Tax=Levilactobacillus enshiensis TaxID=2590213 RepID=UPI00117BB745|nr:hypothetical protein [Levilactobacillus enshiensis]